MPSILVCFPSILLLFPLPLVNAKVIPYTGEIQILYRKQIESPSRYMDLSAWNPIPIFIPFPSFRVSKHYGEWYAIQANIQATSGKVRARDKSTQILPRVYHSVLFNDYWIHFRYGSVTPHVCHSCIRRIDTKLLIGPQTDLSSCFSYYDIKCLSSFLSLIPCEDDVLWHFTSPSDRWEKHATAWKHHTRGVFSRYSGMYDRY